MIDVLAVLGRVPTAHKRADRFDAVAGRMRRDDTARVYAPWRRLHGHAAAVTHLDWSDDARYVRSNSNDYEILVWDAHGGAQVRCTARS